MGGEGGKGEWKKEKRVDVTKCACMSMCANERKSEWKKERGYCDGKSMCSCDRVDKRINDADVKIQGETN